MLPWLRLARAIDRLNEAVGRASGWLVLLMVLVGAYNAIVRYAGRYWGLNLSSNVYIELQWYLFSLVFLLGAGYALKHRAHVRVDVFYARLSPRGQAWIDLIGTIVFLVPVCGVLLWVSWPSIINSWSILEVSPDPGGLPRYPIKSVLLLAFVLLLLQGVAEGIRNIAVLSGHDLTPDDHAAPPAPPHTGRDLHTDDRQRWEGV
jgi:TRAP-type mannitol/chloroaromatic compound transport system permease small subunit